MRFVRRNVFSAFAPILALTIIASLMMGTTADASPASKTSTSKPLITVCEYGGICANPKYFSASATAPTNGARLNLSGPTSVAAGAFMGCALAVIVKGAAAALAPETAGASEVVDVAGSEWTATCDKGILTGGIAAAVRGTVRWLGSLNPFVVSPAGFPEPTS